MSNPNEWSQFYNTNQPFFTTTTTVTTTTTTTGEETSTNSHLSPETGRVTKPTRRRSRASRRTPTTLLNTDTTNFRAMVQQFTGGPSAMAFGSSTNPTSGFSLTSDPSAGSSQQTPWQYNFQPHAPTQGPPQRPYMFSLSNVSPAVGYNNMNTVASGVYGTAEGGGGGGGGGSAPSSKEEYSNTSSSRLQ